MSGQLSGGKYLQYYVVALSGFELGTSRTQVQHSTTISRCTIMLSESLRLCNGMQSVLRHSLV